jgi:uncharacterized membrane protein YraQ (UPF0718 family)
MILAALPDPSPTGDILVNFLSILFEGAPYILIGTLLSGFIDAFLPAKLLERMLPKNKIVSTFAAGFLGLIFPVCECAVVPVVRRLVQKGLPLSCALTYLLSAPIINPIVILSTMTAFKTGDWGMTLARVSLGYTIAVVIGLFLLKKRPEQVLTDRVVAGIAKEASGGHTAPEGFDSKVTHAMRTAMRDFLDTAMYFAIGVMITSVFNTQVDQSRIEAVAAHEYVAIPSMMGLAFVLALCSTSDAFIAAPMSMPYSGLASAAKLAFLVFGPMLDVKLVFMYASVFRRKFLIWLCVALFLLVGLLSKPWGMLFHFPTTKPNAGGAAAVESVAPKP